MSYSPNNVNVFTAAYYGAITGMSASGRVLADTVAANYAAVAAVAGAFAQAFDTEWGSASANELDLGVIQFASQGVWMSRFPNARDIASFNPNTYLTLCAALKATVQASEAYFASQGITPPTPGGGSSVAVRLNGSDIVNPATILDFLNFGANVADAGGGTASISVGGYANVATFGGGEDVNINYAAGNSQAFRFTDAGTLDLSPAGADVGEIPNGLILTLQVLGSFPVTVQAGDVSSSLLLENPLQPGTYIDLETETINFFPSRSTTWLYNPGSAAFLLLGSSNFETINAPPLESLINGQQVILAGDGSGSRFTGQKITVIGPASAIPTSDNTPGWIAVYAEAVNDEDRLLGVGAKNQPYVIIPRQPIVQSSSADTQAIDGDVIVTGADIATSTVFAPLNAFLGARFTVQAGASVSPTFNTVLDFSTNDAICNGANSIVLDTQYQSRTCVCVGVGSPQVWIVEAEYNP